MVKVYMNNRTLCKMFDEEIADMILQKFPFVEVFDEIAVELPNGRTLWIENFL